jgi:hypothetical protein
VTSLSDKLKALGVKVGAAHLPPPAHEDRKPAGRPIHSVVGGEYRATSLGEVFVSERSYAEDYRHGNASPLPFSSSPVISQWAGDARIAELPPGKFAFLDTETSGLAGGTGTFAFLVGAARIGGEGLVLQQFFMRDPSEEPALLEGLANFLAPCEALVTFNGKAFDAPLLATRYSLHRIPLPFKGYAHLDLLPLARRLWRDRLPSRALKYLEEHVLEFTRASEEVPGYEIPWLYFDYLRTGDAGPLAGVFYHNAMDVVAMAALLNLLSGMTSNPYEGRVQHGQDFVALGRLFEDLGRRDESARLYERGLEAGLAPADFEAAVRRLSILQKKRGDLDRARQWWERAAAKGHIYAHIELAKYHEHRARNLKASLKWARSARRLVAQANLPTYVRKHWLQEIDHRLARLERKAGI